MIIGGESRSLGAAHPWAMGPRVGASPRHLDGAILRDGATAETRGPGEAELAQTLERRP